MPGKIIDKTVVLNKKGDEKLKTEIVIKTVQVDNGVVVSFIQGERNNTKLTEKDSEVENALKKDYKPSEECFFDDIVLFNQTEKEKIINGKECIEFEYVAKRVRTEKKKEIKEIETGKLWIEKNSGQPILREFSTKPLSKKVKEMNITIHYSNFENGATVSKMEVKMIIRFMLLKFKVNTPVTYYDHWKYE